MSVRQRAARDCGVAALATVLEERYERVAAVLSATGAYNREVLRAARHLRVTLTPSRAFDPDTATGVLRVRWNGPPTKGRRRGGHFVALNTGLIWCPGDGVSMPWRDYLTLHQARPGTLLEITADRRQVADRRTTSTPVAVERRRGSRRAQ